MKKVLIILLAIAFVFVMYVIGFWLINLIIK